MTSDLASQLVLAHIGSGRDNARKPRLLDLFCGAGGAAVGYARAGFEVVGVDINLQPHYPFEFHQADALTFPLDGFDVIHASPPCQAYSTTKGLRQENVHPELVEPTRAVLRASGVPYVIENVVGAPLENPLMLCGSMFDLRVYRHRLFECDPPIYWPPHSCNHSFPMPASKGQYHTLDKQNYITAVGHNFSAESGRIAMKIDWMTRDEMAQAIPPAYTEWIGRQLRAVIERAA